MVDLPLKTAWDHALISNRWNEALHGVASSPGVTFADAGNDYSYATVRVTELLKIFHNF
jgi:hypothetical protein